MGKRKKPIECYKILEKISGRLVSPLYGDYKGGDLWAVGEINKTGLEYPDIYDGTRWLGGELNSLHGGGFHACKTLKDAEKFLKYFAHKDKTTLVIAKCEITLDTKFAYEGLAVWDSWDPGIQGYISESLKVIEVL